MEWYLSRDAGQDVSKVYCTVKHPARYDFTLSLRPLYDEGTTIKPFRELEYCSRGHLECNNKRGLRQFNALIHDW